MSDWRQDTREDYQRKGLGVRAGYGAKPVLLLVDFINGFTDPSTPLGGDLTGQIAATKRLLAECRAQGQTIVYTTIAYAPDLRDAGMWIKKIPSLEILTKGSPMVEIDERVCPRRGERVVEKKFASAFFGTYLDAYLRGLGIDTVIMTGCTTSGCIRASAVDSIQYGYYTVVVGDAVGDRAKGPHDANLFDIEAKYGDVVSSHEVLTYLRSLEGTDGLAGQANVDFRRWWGAESPPAEDRRRGA